MGVRALFELKGKVALITGGSRGLGLQIAEALGEMGCKVALTARKADELAAAQAHLATLGIEAFTVANDLAKFEGIPALVDEVVERFGTIDILVNNAGATWGAPAEAYPDAAWNKVMNLNINAMFFLSREVGRRCMIPRGCGKIVNIASVAGLYGGAGMQTIAYNTSKAAAINFTRALASEWGKYNINVNAICPGFFPTKMSSGLLERIGEQVTNKTPLKRLGGDEDLKGVAVFLASEASRHITGQYVAVDGGREHLMSGEDLFFGIDIPFARLVGARGVECGEGRALATVEVRPDLTNSRGYAHGGLIAALLDITMGSAARSLDRDTTRVVTVNLTTSFVRGGQGTLTFEAQVLHAGKTLATCEGEARDASGALVAKSTGTFKVGRDKP